VCRVYIGSFNADVPIRQDINPNGKALFEAEQTDLLNDLSDIPARGCDRKVPNHLPPRRAKFMTARLFPTTL
jgi:EH domain-containing protein 1